MHLLQLLDRAARSRPNAMAIKPFTYTVLAERVEEIRQTFRENGIGRPDRVVVANYNHPTMMAVNMLAAAIHAVCVPATPRSIDEVVGRVNAQAVLTDFGLSLTGRPRPVEEACDPCCMILLTSGTTGRPKAVRLSHDNLCASAEAWAAGMRLLPDDRCLCATPLAHGSYIANVLGSIAVGAEVVCVMPREIEQQIAYFRPTWMPMTPVIAQQIRDARSLRFARASKCASEEIEAALGVPVLASYGMTEAGSGPVAIGRYGASTGRPVHLKVRIAGDGFDCVGGGVGEIAVKGPSVMLGYHDGPAHPVDADGWLKTGDLGRLDDRGWLYLTGRVGWEGQNR